MVKTVLEGVSLVVSRQTVSSVSFAAFLLWTFEVQQHEYPHNFSFIFGTILVYQRQQTVLWGSSNLHSIVPGRIGHSRSACLVAHLHVLSAWLIQLFSLLIFLWCWCQGCSGLAAQLQVSRPLDIFHPHQLVFCLFWEPRNNQQRCLFLVFSFRRANLYIGWLSLLHSLSLGWR